MLQLQPSTGEKRPREAIVHARVCVCVCVGGCVCVWVGVCVGLFFFFFFLHVEFIDTVCQRV